jgi:hypothetical protein
VLAKNNKALPQVSGKAFVAVVLLFLCFQQFEELVELR